MITLRPYQEASKENLRQGFRDGHAKQILCAPTGAGKSIIALSLIQSALEKGSRCIFACDRRILVDQFVTHLDAHSIDAGVLMAGHWRYRPQARVQVCSIQTLERMNSWPETDILILDEVHAVMRKSVMAQLKKRPALKVVGASATPFHPELKNHFTSVTSVTTMRELVDDGHLVPFRVFAATEIDTRGVKVTAGEWQKDELESRGLKIVGDVVADYIKIYQQVWGAPRKTICFSSGVAHGAELVRKFAEHGLNFVQISYLDDDEYKSDVLKDFARHDTDIIGVISTDVLMRGFDQTDVEHVIIARPLRKSFSMHVQMVGRGARPHDGKEFCCIQDNSGNWLRFMDSWQDLYGNGVSSLDNDADSRTRKEPTEKEKKAAKCPKCFMLWPSVKTDICPSCGFVRERKNNAQSVAGEMLELTDTPVKEKYSHEVKQEWYSMLLAYARLKNYNDGWVAHKYKSKMKVWPRSMADVAVAPSQEVLNYITSQNIAFSKGKRPLQGIDRSILDRIPKL